MSHTQEPWVLEKNRPYIIQPSHPSFNWIASVQTSNVENWEDNARRIVACVNWCAGIETEKLEKLVGADITATGLMGAGLEQNAALLEALKIIRSKAKSATCCHPNAVDCLLAEGIEIADLAIAKATGHNDNVTGLAPGKDEQQ